MKSKYQSVAAQLSVFPISDRLFQTWPTFVCIKMTLLAVIWDGCTCYTPFTVCYILTCLSKFRSFLPSILFLQMKNTVSQRETSAAEKQLLATLSFVLLLACLSECVPALFRALIIWLLHLHSRKVPRSQEKVFNRIKKILNYYHKYSSRGS